MSSWIEGVGDEVTVGLVVAFLLGVFLVAWLSTGIREIPFISVIVVQLRRRRQNAVESPVVDIQQQHLHDQTEQQPTNIDEHDVNNDDTSADIITENQPDSILGNDQDVTASVNENLPSSVPNVDNQSVQECSGITVDVVDSVDDNNEVSRREQSNVDENIDKPETATELRQRRLEFLSRQQKPPDSNSPHNASSEPGDVSQNPPTSTGSSSSVASAKSLSQLASSFLSQGLRDNSSSHADPTSETPPDVVSDSDPTSGLDQTRPSSNGDNESQDDPPCVPGEIRVRIKFLNDTQRLVTAPQDETIGNFRRRHFASELSQLKLVRFIFNGRDLRDDTSTLQGNNIIDNSVVHCLVTAQRREEQPHAHGEEAGIDIGMIMFPIFGFLLAVIWYMRFCYRHLFNVTSTLTLAGITSLYVLGLVSVLRPFRQHEHID